MAHTTVADFEAYAGETYDADVQTRIAFWLPIAERKLARRVGQDFYTLEDPAPEDWVFATCVIADWLWTTGETEDREALVGPYKSERLGDYAYTLKDSVDETTDKRWSIWKDPRLTDILALYYVASDPARTYAIAAGRAYPRTETSEIGQWWLS
jgi:hypothetical protein